MRRLAALLIVIFGIGSPLFAQDTCGDGLPCGVIPWPLPELPELVSPSPFPTIEITSTLTPSPGPSLTPTNTLTPSPYPTLTAYFDTGGIDDSLATIQALGSATAIVIVNADGTPFSEDYAGLGTNAGDFFGYVRGLSEANFGVLTPLLMWVLSAFIFILVVKTSQYAMPLFAAIFGVLRKIVQLVLDFIPG